MNNQFFKCGCSIRDEEYVSGLITKIVFRKCKKHSKEFTKCSWEMWAKNNAPAQYKKYRREK